MTLHYMNPYIVTIENLTTVNIYSSQNPNQCFTYQLEKRKTLLSN